MPTPNLEWITYDVSVAATARAAPAPMGAEFEAVAPADAEEVTIPNLHQWPQARDKVAILLDTAAEIEHALLVQYLYAAFSLKGSGEVTEPAQKAALNTWRRLLVTTAREEMGHLMTVDRYLNMFRGANGVPQFPAGGTTPLNRRLVTLSSSGDGVAAVPFGLPATLHLPATEPERCRLHRRRTDACLTQVEQMRGDPTDATDPDLGELIPEDRERLTQMPASTGALLDDAHHVRPA